MASCWEEAPFLLIFSSIELLNDFTRKMFPSPILSPFQLVTVLILVHNGMAGKSGGGAVVVTGDGSNPGLYAGISIGITVVLCFCIGICAAAKDDSPAGNATLANTAQTGRSEAAGSSQQGNDAEKTLRQDHSDTTDVEVGYEDGNNTDTEAVTS